MTSTFRQFVLISVVGMTLTVSALIYAHVHLSEQYLAEYLDSHNQNLAVVLRNSLLARGLEQALQPGGPGMTPELRARIDRILDTELRWVPVIKVKIYAADASVLYSSRAEEIGEDASTNEGVLGALQGTPVSGRVPPNHFNEFDQVIELKEVHQQYVPIRSLQNDEIIGVFETYLNVYEVVREIDARQRGSFWIIGAILVAFFAALALVFNRTYRLLQSENHQRLAHLGELNQIHADLEQRVAARTEELDQAREFLQSVIDGIGNPLLVIRPDFSIALMNREARNHIPPGTDPDEIRYCYQVSHRLENPCTDPDHPCAFETVHQHGQPVRVRHRHLDTDGNPMIVDLLTTPLYSPNGEFEGVIEVEHDVTQLVQVQAGLVESEARLQATMDNVPDAILTCDLDFRVDSANRSAGELFHAVETDLIGLSMSELMLDETDPNAALSSKLAYRQTRMRRLDDTEFPADLWIGPLEQDGMVVDYILVVRDITSRIQSQREIDASRQQYFHQDKMVAIGQLAAGILHEVGNPIAAIAGAAEQIRQSALASDAGNETMKNIELIDEQITRLGNITREIADFASPKPRQRELFDLNGLLRSTTRLLTYDRRFSSIGVDLQLDRNLPAVVGVADQLTQVFMNLLINAMDACVGRDTDECSVIVSSEAQGENVHVCVQDFGVGMSEETLERVLEMFYTTKPVGKGSGLGLSLCDTIVRAHGGTLKIESQEGKGTSVHVILPIDRDASEGE